MIKTTCISSEHYHKQTDDFNTAITALRKRSCHPSLRELHKLWLQNLKVDYKYGSTENVLIRVQSRTTQAHLDPILQSIPPADQLNNQPERDRAQPVQDASQATLKNAVNEEHIRIKEIFIDAMPNFIENTAGPKGDSNN